MIYYFTRIINMMIVYHIWDFELLYLFYALHLTNKRILGSHIHNLPLHSIAEKFKIGPNQEGQ